MKETKVKEEITMADLGNHIACPFCSEEDKRIKELEQKMQELQEVDNKRAFRLYAVLYDVLEKQDSENVASRIEYMTSENYADICEMYKTAKNLKQHDRELVKEVCEKIKEKTFGLWYFVLNEQKEHFEGNRYVLSQKDFNDILDQIQKEYEK